jgi:antitoxin MazE
MRTQVRKWGNSASIRIPASVLAAAELCIDQDVNVREEDGRVIIEPIVTPAYRLDDLLDKITPENSPDAVDFGRPVGNETW